MFLRAALTSWRDKVTNKDLYGDRPKVTRKVRERRLSAAGHFHRHQNEAAGTLVLWDPRHGSPGSSRKTYVQILLTDTGLDRNLWKSTAVYRHDDDDESLLHHLRSF